MLAPIAKNCRFLGFIASSKDASFILGKAISTITTVLSVEYKKNEKTASVPWFGLPLAIV
jgi:hypothetical protein